MELDERAARVKSPQLLDPLLAGRPGGERRPELRLERVVTAEDAAGFVTLAGLVQLVQRDGGRAPRRRRELRSDSWSGGVPLRATGCVAAAGSDSTSSAERTAAPTTTTAANAASAATTKLVRTRGDTQPD